MMKKQYVSPLMEVEKLEAMDIVTLSTAKVVNPAYAETKAKTFSGSWDPDEANPTD